MDTVTTHTASGGGGGSSHGAGLLLLESGGPSLAAAVYTFLAGTDDTASTMVRDLDGCRYDILFYRAAATLNEKANHRDGGGDICAPCRPTQATIRMHHAIPFEQLDTFRNVDAYLGTTAAEDDGIVPRGWASLWKPNAHTRLGRVRSHTEAAKANDESDYDDRARGVAELVLPPSVMADEAHLHTFLDAAAKLRVLLVMPLFTVAARNVLSGTALEPPTVMSYHPSTGEAMALYTEKNKNLLVTMNLMPPTHSSSSNANNMAEAAVLLRQFLRALQEVRRSGCTYGMNDAQVAAAPLFSFSDDPNGPAELPADTAQAMLHFASTNRSDTGEHSNAARNTLWCTFQLARHHLTPVTSLFSVVTSLLNFRSNVMYHIHTARSAMHAMLRKRVAGSLDTLGMFSDSMMARAYPLLEEDSDD